MKIKLKNSEKWIDFAKSAKWRSYNKMNNEQIKDFCCSVVVGFSVFFALTTEGASAAFFFALAAMAYALIQMIVDD